MGKTFCKKIKQLNIGRNKEFGARETITENRK